MDPRLLAIRERIRRPTNPPPAPVQQERNVEDEAQLLTEEELTPPQRPAFQDFDFSISQGADTSHLRMYQTAFNKGLSAYKNALTKLLTRISSYHAVQRSIADGQTLNSLRKVPTIHSTDDPEIRDLSSALMTDYKTQTQSLILYKMAKEIRALRVIVRSSAETLIQGELPANILLNQEPYLSVHGVCRHLFFLRRCNVFDTTTYKITSAREKSLARQQADEAETLRLQSLSTAELIEELATPLIESLVTKRLKTVRTDLKAPRRHKDGYKSKRNKGRRPPASSSTSATTTTRRNGKGRGRGIGRGRGRDGRRGRGQ